jgi:hypothetical protein
VIAAAAKVQFDYFVRSVGHDGGEILGAEQFRTRKRKDGMREPRLQICFGLLRRDSLAAHIYSWNPTVNIVVESSIALP